jgi:hypothetical protein
LVDQSLSAIFLYKLNKSSSTLAAAENIALELNSNLQMLCHCNNSRLLFSLDSFVLRQRGILNS